MTKRDRWVAHLTSSHHVHRFLARIGAASDPAVAPAVNPDALKAYLESLRGGAADERILLEVIELLTQSYSRFCEDSLPKLLSALANRTEHNQETVGPGLRGVIRWDLTKLGRINRTLPSARYVSNVQFRSFDTPENQLLAWLMRDIERAIALIARRIGTTRLHSTLKSIRNESQAALRHELISPQRLVRGEC